MRMRKGVTITVTVALASLIVGASGTSAQNQTSQVFITWRASNFYPAHFEGKAIPSAGSPVAVAVETIKNGALLNLAQAEIAWELDGRFLAGGKGVKYASFISTKGSGDAHHVHVSVSLGGEVFESSLRIPVTKPTVALDAPYPNRRGIKEGMTFRALPFFFNVPSLDELSFSWLIDGERKNTGSDNELTVTGGGNLRARSFSVTLETQNRTDPQETATTRGQFSIAP
jgi:hypothetical protein